MAIDVLPDLLLVLILSLPLTNVGQLCLPVDRKSRLVPMFIVYTAEYGRHYAAERKETGEEYLHPILRHRSVLQLFLLLIQNIVLIAFIRDQALGLDLLLDKPLVLILVHQHRVVRIRVFLDLELLLFEPHGIIWINDALLGRERFVQRLTDVYQIQ